MSSGNRFPERRFQSFAIEVQFHIPELYGFPLKSGKEFRDSYLIIDEKWGEGYLHSERTRYGDTFRVIGVPGGRDAYGIRAGHPVTSIGDASDEHGIPVDCRSGYIGCVDVYRKREGLHGSVDPVRASQIHGFYIIFIAIESDDYIIIAWIHEGDEGSDTRESAVYILLGLPQHSYRWKADA